MRHAIHIIVPCPAFETLCLVCSSMNTLNPFAAISEVVCIVLVCTLAACAAVPQVIEKPLQGAGLANPVVQSYAQLMDLAQEALQRNEAWVALGFLERAAKNEPAKKQPWQRIAQLQFDAQNYGLAITSANEVLVRDNADLVAKRILVLSGMRVSAQAYEQLDGLTVLDASSQSEASALLARMQPQAKPSGHSGLIRFTPEERRAMEQPIRRVHVPSAVPTKPGHFHAAQPQKEPPLQQPPQPPPQPGAAYDPLRALRN
jgi:hypothetical protein